jgi:UDP-N-acetylglucosamine--N-acetylmuramyl-(pentapeptide) pyrophosphoryl-undecaprenol N-acetylglucosamine transferase
VPALAVAAALRAEGAEVVFIGGERAEAELVPGAGYPLRTISVEGLSRTNPLKAARSLLRALAAVVRARRLLGEIEPDAVMGGGGYVAGPVGLAALSRRIPLVLTEADSHLGLSNRALAPWARRVCLAFPSDRGTRRRRGPLALLPGRLGGGRYRVTGRPIPAFAHDREGARERLGIAPDDTCVLVFGGSLGARSINLAAIDAFGGGAFRVLHVCGRRDYPELCAASGEGLRAGYELREYMDLEEFADALSAADLVVARAGGSVFEIAAHGLPAILIPYPHAAGDHQSANARWMEQAGAAVVVPDGELSAPRLAREVGALLGDRSRLAAMAAAARRLARPDAAAEVARELLEAAGA